MFSDRHFNNFDNCSLIKVCTYFFPVPSFGLCLIILLIIPVQISWTETTSSSLLISSPTSNWSSVSTRPSTSSGPTFFYISYFLSAGLVGCFKLSFFFTILNWKFGNICSNICSICCLDWSVAEVLKYEKYYLISFILLRI